jgi:hypothetical protein
MPKTDAEVLAQEKEKTEIKIQGEIFQIGKLKYRQILKLTKAITKMFIRNIKRFRELKADGKNILEDIMNIMDILDESEITDILCIILEKDMGFCSDLTACELSELSRILYEYNYDDIAGTLKNWQRTITAKQS